MVMTPTQILNPAQREKSKTYLVNKLREAVFSWREQNYPGVSNTTRRLLNFWFKDCLLYTSPSPRDRG